MLQFQLPLTVTSTVQAHPVQVTTDTEKDTDTEKVAMEDATTDRTTDLITKIINILAEIYLCLYGRGTDHAGVC